MKFPMYINYKFSFIILLITAFLIRIGIVFAFPGTSRPDELFQYVEPAHLLVYGTGIMTWDWRDGIRSWMLPDFFAGIMWLGKCFGISSPFALLRIVLSFLSLPLVWLFFRVGKKRYGYIGAITFGIAATFWPDIANASFRTGVEYIGGNLLSFAVILLYFTLDFEDRNEKQYTKNMLFISFLLGLSIAIRFQYAPAALITLIIALKQSRKLHLFSYLISFFMPISLLGVIDWATLDYPYQSIFRNIYINIIAKHSETLTDSSVLFSKQSLIFYAKWIATQWGPMSLLIAILALKGRRESGLCFWMGAFIFFYFSLIGHKESPYIYPAIVLFVFSAAHGLSCLIERWNVDIYKSAGLEIACCILLFCSTYAPQLKDKSNVMRLQISANHRTDICGLGFYGAPPKWAFTGGYTNMKKGIPFYLMSNPLDIHTIFPKFNYLITSDTGYLPNKMTPIKCVDHRRFCLYKTAQTCSQSPDFNQFSEKMRAMGQ